MPQRLALDHNCRKGEINTNYLLCQKWRDQYFNTIEKLDVIIMSHVIEHLDTPFEDLKKIRDKMTNENQRK